MNQLLASGFFALNVFQFFVLPFVLLSFSAWWALIAVPLFFFNNTLWSLTHEAVHNSFHSDPKINDRWGRALAISMGASFHILRFTHLMHHRFGRRWDAEVYDRRSSSWLKEAPGFYFILLGGLYYLEVVGSLLLAAVTRRAGESGIGKIAALKTRAEIKGLEGVAVNFFYGRKNRVTLVRCDVAVIVVLFAVSGYLYGPFWPVLMAILAGRAFAISFLDNSYHYATPLDDSTPGRELYLPTPVSRFLLNFNLHRTHHNHMDVPWPYLPAVHEAKYPRHDGPFLGTAMRQFAGPVDIDTMR